MLVCGVHPKVYLGRGSSREFEATGRVPFQTKLTCLGAWSVADAITVLVKQVSELAEQQRAALALSRVRPMTSDESREYNERLNKILDLLDELAAMVPKKTA